MGWCLAFVVMSPKGENNMNSIALNILWGTAPQDQKESGANAQRKKEACRGEGITREENTNKR
jgi:hypothetical protein